VGPPVRTPGRTLRLPSQPCREILWVSLLLLALLVVFFEEALFTGRKLLPADIAYTDPVFSDSAPAGFIKPHNVLLYDQAYQFYPWRVYVSQVLRQGSLPFWNPYTYCGTPLLAEDQPAVFYPLNIISYPLPPADAVLFTALLRLFVAGLSTYWFVRTIGLGPLAAVFSAVTFTFSGFMVVWLGHPHTNVAAWLPALFLTVEWLCRRTSPRNVAWVAFVVATQLTGGHAETALYTLSAGALYCLFRVWREWHNPTAIAATDSASLDGRRDGPQQNKRALVRLCAFGVAVLLGFALASVHLLPFGEWLSQSAELQFRTQTESLQLSGLGPKYWLAGVLPMWLPNIFNNPTWPGEYRSFFPGWNYAEQTLYVGVIGWALAAVAVAAQFLRLARGWVAARRISRHIAGLDARVWFFSALGLVALGAALRTPLFDLLNHLPLFNIAAYGRLRLIYTFCAAVLAGFGLDLVADDVSNRAHRALLGILGGLILVGTLVLWIAPGALRDLAVQVQGAEARQALYQAIQAAFQLSNVRMYWPILASAAAALMILLYLKAFAISPTRSAAIRRGLLTLLFLLAVADLFALGLGYHTTVDEGSVFPETPALQALKRDSGLYRVAATHVDLMPNTGILHGLQDVRGLDFPIRRYQEFCQSLGGQDWLGYGILLSSQLQPRLLGLLNTKYILTSSELDPEVLGHLRLLTEDGQIQVYENLDCLPRAFVVHQVHVQPDGESVLQALQDPSLDLASEIVLEKSPPPKFVPTQSLQAGEEKCDVIRYEGNHVRILTRTRNDGFLFLSDTYYPDWKAYVDGAETEIYRADYAFRAVYLSAGQHVVEFVYEPRTFRWAAVISLAVLLGLSIGVAQPRLPRQKKGETLPRQKKGETPRSAVSAEAQGRNDDHR
jgi:hypothetical protein